ncbi:hypothetical protein EG327_007067 [Venturia inaequalis]|uniref:DUF7730 domain-containing protein n=1 Tax=Venturia inaequalis TaxID=5025 RepID=A0A8H3V1E4_VENIN|nr:hypothetical protein EG327_007067 [Venturia inaequalis]
MAVDRKSRGVLSTLFKKKKKQKSPGILDLMPATEQHTTKTPSSPFSSSGWASLSRSSLAETINSRSTGTTILEKGKRPVYEDFGGFLPTPPQTPYTPSVQLLDSPISPRNFGPSPSSPPRPTYPTPETSSPLLLLPAEIRNSIYLYIIGTPIIRLHTETIATSLTSTGKEHRFEDLSLNPNYRWEHPEPPRNTVSWLYHSGHSMRNVTRLWRTCKQVYHESYTLSLSKTVFSFGNHLVAQDFLSHTLSDGIHPSAYVQTLHSTTLSQLQNIPTQDLRKFTALKRVVIQCPEKLAWEWEIWDEMPKERRDAERDKEKQAVRETVYDVLRDAFPDRHIDIQRDVGIPLTGEVDEERLMLEWDGVLDVEPFEGDRFRPKPPLALRVSQFSASAFKTAAEAAVSRTVFDFKSDIDDLLASL